MAPLIIRADANAHIGSGHLLRCLALAQAWKRRGEAAVFLSCFEESAWAKRLEMADFVCVGLPKTNSEKPTLEALRAFPKSPVVVDGYEFSPQLRPAIRAAGHWLLCLDDEGFALGCDATLNQNLGAQALFPHSQRSPNFWLGPQFALLREEFISWRGWMRPIQSQARHVLVTLGGSDGDNGTESIVAALKTLSGADWQFRVLLGASNQHETLVRRCIGSDARFEVWRDVQQMPQQLAWAEIAIAGAGSVSWELAFFGVAELLLVTADNQRLIAEELDKIGVARNLGRPPWNLQTVALAVEQLARDVSLRQTMAQRGQQLVDGSGADRVAEFIVRAVARQEENP